MSLDPHEKRQVRVSIYNQEFTLLVPGAEAAAELEEAAQEVDELMTSIARTGNMDSTRVAVLACLHLQDKVRSLERELTDVQNSIADRTRELTVLLDSVVD